MFLHKAVKTQSSSYSQFIIVTENRGVNMAIHAKIIGLSAYILTRNFNLKSLPASPSHQQHLPFCINCVTSGNVGRLLCRLLWSSLKPHGQFAPHAGKSNTNQRMPVETISGWPPMTHGDHDLFPATSAITSGTCSTQKHGLRHWLPLLCRSCCWGCISFHHQLVLPDCCTVQLLRKKLNYKFSTAQMHPNFSCLLWDAYSFNA